MIYIKVILDRLPFSSLNIILNTEISTLAGVLDSLTPQMWLEETFNIIKAEVLKLSGFKYRFCSRMSRVGVCDSSTLTSCQYC